MRDYKNWLIVGLSLVAVAFVWLSVECSRTNAQEKIYKECNSYQMWEDGSYTCEKDNRVQQGCIEGAICED